MFAQFAPVLWEELVGLADELGVTMERAAFRFANDGLRPPIGAGSATMTADVYGLKRARTGKHKSSSQSGQ
jgi:hypothetical protein